MNNSRAKGFTLMELLLVMVILLTILAITFPRLNRSGQAAELRHAANELADTARCAREESIKRRLKTRMLFSENGCQYWIRLQSPIHSFIEEYVPFNNAFLDEVRTLPQSVAVDEIRSATSTRKPDMLTFWFLDQEQAEIHLVSNSGLDTLVHTGGPNDDPLDPTEAQSHAVH
jgi:prepilin-type N-terminal cleavage/methylation domain-containing protein